MSAILYTSSKGHPVNTHSYSSGSTFRSCRRKYYLEKAQGWKERENKASRRFGECVESAIQFFHASNCKPLSGVDELKRLWLLHKDVKDLSYTSKEGSWQDLYQMGGEMLALYEIKWVSFGYRAPKFQLNFRKEICPGSYLAGLDFTAYIDMHAQTDSGPVVIDIKTAALPLDVDPRMLTLDPQLRSYSWVSGVPQVAFLWFAKSRPESYMKGNTATLLADVGKFKAGEEVRVLRAAEMSTIVEVLSDADFELFEKEAKGLKGKALETKKQEFAEQHAVAVGSGQLTKQRLQYVQVRIPDDDIREAGEAIAGEIADIYASNQKNSWPKEPSVRFPDQKCTFCKFQPICIGDDKTRDETLYQITSASAAEKPADDWLAEFEAA